MRNFRNYCILFAAVLILFLPFVHKPFNVDDPFYLTMARQIAHDPLHPYSFTINWSGEPRDVWRCREASFPPLIPYVLALLVKFFGEKETVLHLFFLVFPLLSAAGMYLLARRYTRHPLAAALCFLGVPAFLVSATGIMLDVSMTAFMLLSAVLFLRGMEGDRGGMLAASMACASTALLIKYTALLLVPLFAAELLLKRKYRLLFFLLIPLAVFGAWNGYTWLVYGEPHFLAASYQVGLAHLSVHKLLAFMTFVSGCFVFPVFSAAVLRGKGRGVAAGGFLLLTAIGLLLFGWSWYAVFFAVLSFSTVTFLYCAVRFFPRTAPFLNWWLVLSLGASFFLEPWMAGRYLLPALVPALLLFFSWIDAENLSRRTTYGVTSTVVLFGILAGAADYLWARSAKDFAGYLRGKGYSSGCFAGHFGFQYYLERGGWKAVNVNEGGCDGKYFAVSAYADPQRPSPELLSRLSVIEVRTEKNRLPFRVTAPYARAGFYSSFWGIFPYSFSRAPLDIFTLYRVEPVRSPVSREH